MPQRGDQCYPGMPQRGDQCYPGVYNGERCYPGVYNGERCYRVCYNGAKSVTRVCYNGAKSVASLPCAKSVASLPCAKSVAPIMRRRVLHRSCGEECSTLGETGGERRIIPLQRVVLYKEHRSCFRELITVILS